jgi:adenylate kinase
MNKGLLVPSDLAEGLIAQNIKAALENSNLKGVLLDGHPRTIAEAEVLDATLSSLKITAFMVVNVKLETSVAVKRLLNRKQCVTCGESFNTADIVMDDYDMPAILPSKETCKLGGTCNPVLTTRGDDTEAAIKTRLQQHDVNVAPILAYYERRGILRTFNVHKGAKDADALIKLILQQ